ncbi:MAG: DUF2971 domain-containing protein [Chloroflexi bacterium]|nr:DUF2971 domain-containing protein [Chloroflexota bacterium]
MEGIEDIRQDITKQAALYASGEFNSYFKYCSDNPDVIKGIFKDKGIRFTQPRALNDPLEFNPTMRFSGSRDYYQLYDLNGYLFPSIEGFFRVQIIDSQINKFGILSLTKIPNLFDMWSQYANGHRGFIIEFKGEFWRNQCMKSKTGIAYPVKKVEYVEEYTLNLDELVNENKEIPVEIIHRELFLKKTSRWQHEHEYRMVRPLSDHSDYKLPQTKYTYRGADDTNLYLFPFDWDCVASVVLGAYMSVENKEMIASVCETNNIEWSQAFIFRDKKDSFGKPCTVFIVTPGRTDAKEAILQAQPYNLCIDSWHFNKDRSPKSITKLSNLPYYLAHKEIVNTYYDNLKANTSK